MDGSEIDVKHSISGTYTTRTYMNHLDLPVERTVRLMKCSYYGGCVNARHLAYFLVVVRTGARADTIGGVSPWRPSSLAIFCNRHDMKEGREGRI